LVLNQVLLSSDRGGSLGNCLSLLNRSIRGCTTLLHSGQSLLQTLRNSHSLIQRKLVDIANHADRIVSLLLGLRNLLHLLRLCYSHSTKLVHNLRLLLLLLYLVHLLNCSLQALDLLPARNLIVLSVLQLRGDGVLCALHVCLDPGIVDGHSSLSCGSDVLISDRVSCVGHC